MPRHVKIEPHFLVVESPAVESELANGVTNETYRRLNLVVGGTYTEAALREWANETWGERAGPLQRAGRNWNPKLKLGSPLDMIFKTVATGGWLVYETKGMDVKLE